MHSLQEEIDALVHNAVNLSKPVLDHPSATRQQLLRIGPRSCLQTTMMHSRFRSAATIVGLLLPLSDAAYTCPSGFTGLTSSANGAYCFAAFNNNGSGISWSDAEAACVNTGAKLAHLASIRDASQQAAVVTGRCGGTIPAGHAYWVSIVLFEGHQRALLSVRARCASRGVMHISFGHSKSLLTRTPSSQMPSLTCSGSACTILQCKGRGSSPVAQTRPGTWPPTHGLPVSRTTSGPMAMGCGNIRRT